MEEQNGEVDDASFDVLDNVTNVVQYAIVSLFEIIRMMTSEQKEYFLKEITNTSSKRYGKYSKRRSIAKWKHCS